MSSIVPYFAFSDAKPVSTFPESALKRIGAQTQLIRRQYLRIFYFLALGDVTRRDWLSVKNEQMPSYVAACALLWWHVAPSYPSLKYLHLIFLPQMCGAATTALA